MTYPFFCTTTRRLAAQLNHRRELRWRAADWSASVPACHERERARSAARTTRRCAVWQAGQGYPKFDQKRADEHFNKVTDKVAALVSEMIRKWDSAGV